MTSPPLNSYEDRSLCTTWQLSLDQIERRNELSAKLLKLWAYFDREDVWFELLQRGCSTGYDWIQQLTEDELSFNEAIRLLCSYGLVNPNKCSDEHVESRGYSMHSCVHSWTIFVLNKERDEGLARLAFTCITSAIPTDGCNNRWTLQRRLLQHAVKQERFIMEVKITIEWKDGALNYLGHLYAEQGKLAEAEAMYSRALQGCEEALGPKHISTLLTVGNLGNLYIDQGKLAEAEAMYSRALQGFEEALGPKHTSTLDTVHNLGNLYIDQGKLAEAEAMYSRALGGKEEALGPKHTSTLDTIMNQGSLYYTQGKLYDAEAKYSWALQGYEEVLGPDHTSTLDTVDNLGIFYATQRKLTEAEAMFYRALKGREKALGPDHTSTLDTVHKLDLLYADQGKLAEAKKMYDQALQGYENALGLELASLYLLALNTIFVFGDFFSQTNRKDIVKTIYNRALSGYTTVQKPSSNRCRQVEDRLQELQVASAESKVDQNEFIESGVAKSRSLKRKPLSGEGG
ncbi:TPR-like protein [Acephala macrosclerotiorum]|nr:TPR-like protein [Acephala macrosclerotiorum]